MQTFRRSVRPLFEKRLLGEAAAVAFYTLLSVFPALGALLSLSGVVVDIDTAARNLEGLTGVLPAGAAETAKDAISRIAAQGGGLAGLGIGLAAATLWSATAATLQLFGALNVAYGEVENRSRGRLCGTGLLFALAVVAKNVVPGDAADGRFALKGGVGPGCVVVVQPGLQGLGAVD